MIERIMVGLDGSLTAEAILAQARRILYRHDSELLLVQAVPPPVSVESMMGGEFALKAAEEYLQGQAERLMKQGVRVRKVVRMGSPVNVLLDVAEEEKATMIALATHGKSGLKRALFGSVTEELLRQTPLPLLLVRPFWSYDLLPAGKADRRRLRNILLPVDGSGRVRQALAGIVEFAELFEARILLLRILEGADRRAVEAGEKVEAEQELQELATRIGKSGVETVQVLGTGEPAARILEAVREHEIDLLAMVTEGRRGLSRIREGSVTEAVLRKADVPLLVTRVPEAPRKGAPDRLLRRRK